MSRPSTNPLTAEALGAPSLARRIVAGLRELTDCDYAEAAASPHGPNSPRRSLHASEDGLLSFITCIAVLFFTVLVALVLNTGSAVKQKIELQNAADASILTSTSLAARGMNALTMTNHMVGELTAILVIHEALGGSTMDDLIQKGSKGEVSSTSRNLNIALDVGFAADVESPYRTLDEQVVKRLKKDGGSKQDSGGKHLAFASIFDSRLSLKFAMTLCLVGRVIAIIVKAIPIVGQAISIALHIAISVVVFKIGQEILLIDGIEELAKLFSKTVKRRLIENQVLPFMENYGNTCVKQFPIIGERVAKETAKRNGVTLFMFPTRLELPVEPEPAPRGGGFGSEPPHGNAGGGGSLGLLDSITDASDTISDFNKTPFFDFDVPGAPSLGLGFSPPGDGYGPDDNKARRDLPKASASDWRDMSRSQWVRGSYPYVRTWRKPIREWFGGTLLIAQSSKWYSQWSNRYALAKPFWYRTGEYGGKKGQRKLAMYVMKGEPKSGKGREPWTSNGRQAELLFTQMAFVHRDAKTPIAPFLFGSGPKDGMVAYGQAIIYNANPQDAQADGNKIGTFQPTVAWDTLNWTSPTSSARAFEFPHGDDGGFGIIPPAVPFVLFMKAPEHPNVRLNWQAKLTPVTRYGDARLSAAVLMPAKMKKILMKLPLDLGTFRTH